MNTLQDDSGKRTVSRRSFVKKAFIGALAMPMVPGLLGARYRSGGGIDEPSDVVVVHDENILQGYTIQSDVARIMIDEGIKTLTGESTGGEAWMSVFPGITPERVIGIKVNCASSQLPTHPVVVNALAESLTQMTFGGDPFPLNNVVIWERTDYELSAAGFVTNYGTEGIRCFGNSPSWGYGTTTYYVQGIPQHFSRIFEDVIDYNINFGVLKNHAQAGVVFCLKNHYGTPDNISIWPMHYNQCDPYIPGVNQIVRDEFDHRDRLFMIDGIFGAHYGGPGGGPTFVQNEILMSQDVVAADTVAMRILEDQGCTTIGMGHHVATAADPPYSLGNHDPEQISIIRVEEPSTAVREFLDSVVPMRAELHGNYPNPFNPSTTIRFSLHRPSRIRLEIYSSDGRRVKVLLAKELGAGEYEVVWDGRNQHGDIVASGTYYCRLSGLGILETIPIVLLR